MFTFSWVSVAIAAAAGALGAWLANRGIAVYHDGLRAMFPEMVAGRLPPRQLASTAFKLSIGLLVGFALPFSLVCGFLLVHALWLGTDLIGIWFVSKAAPDRNSRLAQVGVVGVGALYGAVLMLGLQGFNHLAGRLPVPLDTARLILSQPVVFTFAAFPAIGLAYQHGLRIGALAFAGILLTRLAADWLGLAQPDVWALACGLLLVTIAALRECSPDNPGSASLFSAQFKHLRRRLPLMAGLGALYGLAAQELALVEGPQSLFALSSGSRTAALAISLARALAFTPIKGMSVLTSGVFVTDGLGFAWSAGLVAPQAWSAALLGGLAMSLEVLALGALGSLLQRAPGLVKTAGSMRTAMTRLLEAALLVGGMLASENLAPGYGFLCTAGLYLINEAAGAPLLRMAVGPVAVLLVWMGANALAFMV
jgi:Protein of unknown function